MESKFYLASDLANELGVARSTINDWLSRYADYLETENRGKRRAYSEKSLLILREISDFRNSGLSSFEIDQQLAARYGLRPEVASNAPEPHEEPAAAPERTEAPAAPGTPEDGAASALPMIRPAFEAMTSQINREFGKLTSQLEALETERRRLSRRLWVMSSIMVAGALILALILAFAARALYLQMADQRAAGSAEVAALGSTMGERVGALQAEQRRSAEDGGKKLAEVTVLLDRSRADFQQSLTALNSELVEQRKVFEDKVKTLESAAATRHEAEVIRLKEEFARNQQTKLAEATAQYEATLAALEKSAGVADGVRAEAVAARRKAEEEAAVARKEMEALKARVAELLEARVKLETQSVPAPKKEVKP